MKKIHMILLTLVVVVLAFAGLAWMKTQGTNKLTKEDKKEDGRIHIVEGEAGEKTYQYEDGDRVYLPAEDSIDYDEDAGLLFYQDMLNVFLTSDVSDEEIEEITQAISGELVGRLKGDLNILQVKVEGESYGVISKLAASLQNHELVKYAKHSVPLFVSDMEGDAEGRTCSMDKDEPVEAAELMASRWWEEATNLPEAWAVSTGDLPGAADTMVSILEIGNLADSLDSVKGNLLGEPNNMKGNPERDHAGLVTKIIAAGQDDDQIRGVVDGVVDVDFTSIGNAPDVAYIKEIIDPILQDKRVVVNNSWGPIPKSEKLFRSDELFGVFKSHDAYLEEQAERREEFAVDLIMMLAELIDGGKKDFIFVQAAGNGFHVHKNESFDESVHADKAESFGYFSNINGSTYQKAEDILSSYDEQLGVDLAEIKDHIMVVGGVEPKEDSRYQFPSWSGYGEVVDIAAPANYFPFGDDCQDGTSFATPMVTGAAALVWAHEPDLSAGEVKRLLLQSSHDYVMPPERLHDERERLYYPMLNMMAFENEAPDFHYGDLIETFEAAVAEGWEQDQLDEYDLGPVPYQPSRLPDNYGYVLKDLNGDGIDEFLVGYDFDEDIQLLTEIYTLVDGEPFKVFASGLRHNANIYENGMIEEYAVLSPGTGEQLREAYIITPEGDKHQKAGYRFTPGIDEDVYESIIEPGTYFSEDKALEMFEEYGDLLEFDFTLFVPDTE